MDPLTTLKLTGSLVHFIDLSIKTLTEARTVYDSGTTTSIQTLREHIEALQILGVRVSKPTVDGFRTADELALAQLLTKGKTLVQETLELLNQLSVKKPKSKIAAVVIAIHAHVKKSELERLEQKALKCRRDIIERWTLMTRSVG